MLLARPAIPTLGTIDGVARRLKGLRVVAPSADSFPSAASYIAVHRLVKFDVGSHWLLDVMLDNGKQSVTKSLEPDLPIIIHY